MARLFREAAVLGPGLGGERKAATDSDRLTLARRFAAAGAIAPAYVLQGAEWVDRRAKLFEAGAFPDRELTVEAGDLARLAAAFDSPVPVLIEHADSPLQLGYVTAVEHEGAELFGTVSLTAEADALVRASGAGFLSIGVAPDFSRLLEVSLVRRPRVPDARLFSHDDPLLFHAELPPATAASNPADEAEVDRLVKTGRLLPTEADAARTLFALGRGRFDSSGGELRRMLVDLLERRPPSPLFSDLAPSPAPESPLMLPEEAAFYRRYFPDVPLGEIAKRRPA